MNTPEETASGKTKKKSPTKKNPTQQQKIPTVFQYTPKSSEVHLSYGLCLPPQSQTNGLYLALQVTLSLRAP